VDDLTPAVLGVVAAVVGGIGAWLNVRRLRKLGVGEDATTVLQGQRDLADIWEQKYELEQAAHQVEVSAHLATKAELAIERQLGAQCRTDLDNVRSDLRALERRRRTPRVDA
jgi:hypothetical protein